MSGTAFLMLQAPRSFFEQTRIARGCDSLRVLGKSGMTKQELHTQILPEECFLGQPVFLRLFILLIPHLGFRTSGRKFNFL